jgi:hypothetical protein
MSWNYKFKFWKTNLAPKEVWSAIDIGRRRVFYLNLSLDDMCFYELKWWGMQMTQEIIALKWPKMVSKMVPKIAYD